MLLSISVIFFFYETGPINECLVHIVATDGLVL